MGKGKGIRRGEGRQQCGRGRGRDEAGAGRGWMIHGADYGGGSRFMGDIAHAAHALVGRGGEGVGAGMGGKGI